MEARKVISTIKFWDSPPPNFCSISYYNTLRSLKETFIMKVSLLLSFILLTYLSKAQNVGINTTTPQASLDVRGNHRVGGLANFIIYDSVTGRIEWRNSNLYVPVTQALMKHSAAADGLFYNNTAPVSGQLEYRNALGQPVFYTNFTNGNGYFKNNLGIGTTSPYTNLHIESSNNNPVYINGTSNLYLTWAENGIPRGYIGSFYGNEEDIDIGTYGFQPTAKLHLVTQGTPRLTVGETGNVGIGINPTVKFHVSQGSVRLEGPGVPFAPYALSIGGYGDVQVDAPGIAGGRFIIRESGYTGIGTEFPSEKLQVTGNVQADSYKFSNAKTYYYSIPAADFQPVYSTDQLYRNYAEVWYIAQTSPYGELSAALHLPHGARVTGMTAYYRDLASPADLSFELAYKGHGEVSGSANLIASIKSSGAPGNTSSTTTNTTSNVTINNLGNYYFVRVNSMNGSALVLWSPLLVVKSVVISYTLSEAQ